MQLGLQFPLNIDVGVLHIWPGSFPVNPHAEQDEAAREQPCTSAFF
jgi:hypothetical protein